MSGTRSDRVRVVNVDVDDERARTELPSLAATEGLRRLRYGHPGPPVRVLGVRDASERGVDGFATGAEDSLPKPFFSAARQAVRGMGYATRPAEAGR
ncbi:hypothetical protein ACFVYF_23460 [Streptomyces sp. NPDC058274]|uniref:hypothetical protein n=1 Tax=Streptomyces sp. NPDC058274 TaxID=3346416 RepID=UPI0036E75FFD